MEWMQTLTILTSFFGMFIYMLARKDKLSDPTHPQGAKNNELESKINELISKNNERIAIIEGYILSEINKIKNSKEK